MRIVFSGSRHWSDEKPIVEVLHKLIEKFSKEKITIISGGARGLDMLAENISKSLDLRFEVFHAEWNTYGSAAGHIRNKRMLESGADLVVAFPLGESRGTRNMIKISLENKTKVLIYENDCWNLIKSSTHD